MRKLLLIGTALTAFSLAMPLAYATEGGSNWNDNGGSREHSKDHDKNKTPVTFDIAIAAALAGNQGNVAGNHASSESQAASTKISGNSYNGSKGVSNTNQNAGANSALQNALAVSYIQGCTTCTSGTPTTNIAAGGALAAAGNSGNVRDNSSKSHREFLGFTKTPKAGRDQGDRDDFTWTPKFGGWPAATADIDSSFNSTTGVFQVNQNSGDNSLLQNSAAVAAATNLGGQIALGVAVGAAGNSGEVEHNKASADHATASATINNSFGGDTGVANVNQNAGANSELQNSAAVAAVTGLKGVKNDLGLTLAGAGNSGEVEHNGAHSDTTSGTAAITGSFNGNTGMVNANQNVGANSQLQNSSAIAALKFCGCATSNASLSVAAAGNAGGVYGNWASAENGSNGASMSNSFNNSTGMLQANQNAGANSLLQNSVAVGVITH